MVDVEHISRDYRLLSDDELQRIANTDLIAAARVLLEKELASRGLASRRPSAVPVEGPPLREHDLHKAPRWSVVTPETGGFEALRRMSGVLLMLIAVCGPAHAERFMGILPGDRLSDVKAKYPHAQFVEETPAWLQAHQRLLSMSGDGISGSVAIELEHEVDATVFRLNQLATKQANGGTLDTMEA